MAGGCCLADRGHPRPPPDPARGGRCASSPAHLYSPGDGPGVVAHSLEGSAERHGACVFPGLQHHRVSRGDDASRGRHPSQLFP